jgi:hypothetical protein
LPSYATDSALPACSRQMQYMHVIGIWQAEEGNTRNWLGAKARRAAAVKKSPRCREAVQQSASTC